MFNDSFSKIPTELIKSKQLSNLEFRVICVLILISSYNNGHSFLGSFKLSDMCGIGRAALRRALHNLENMQLIKITQRGQFSRSNDILLTIPDGIRFLQHGGAAETPRRVDLNDSPCVDLNDSPMVDLNDSRVALNDSPIKNIDSNNLNLNKNRPVDLNESPDQKENTVKKDIETADVAAVRSMPCAASSAKAQQKTDCEAAEAAKLWQSCCIEFKQQFDDISFNSWIEPLTLKSFKDNVFEVQAPTPFIKNFIKINYLDKIIMILKQKNFYINLI